MRAFWFKLGSAAVFLLASMQSWALEPHRETGILPIDPPTPYIRYLPADTPRGRVLVIHGLDVSKEVMQIISAALADGGFEVYSIDLPGHGDSASGFDASRAQRAICNALAQIGADSIVLGHSLGAGLLLDLAADRHFSTMVLLAPPPLSITAIQADRVLIATGDADLPRIREFLPIAADIGSPHVESWLLPWSAHSGPIFNPVHIRRIVEWLGGAGQKTRTLARFVWIGVMLISSLVFGISLMPGRELSHSPVSIPATLVRYVASCGVAVVILRVLNPLVWLKLFATDYLVGFLLLSGLALLIQERKSISVDFNASAIVKAAAAAAFVIIVIGFVVGSHAFHIALSDGRWWRFPCIALAGLPLVISDERAIRQIHSRWKALAVAIITRLLLWAFLLIGVLLISRQSVFLVMIAHLMVLFWIALWFATGIVHRHTQNPLAAALFAAIVQGWAFAAWFVTI